MKKEKGEKMKNLSILLKIWKSWEEQGDMHN